MKITPFQEFQENARVGSRVPIVGELAMDLETPVGIYRNFVDQKYSFLLESVEGGEKWGRYSFIGLYPSIVFKSFGRRVEIIKNGKERVYDSKDPLGELKKSLHDYSFISMKGLPRLTGGAVGLISYDTVRFFEKLPDLKKPGIEVPDLYFIIPKILLVTDSFEQTLKILYDAQIENKGSLKREYDQGCRLIQKIARSLKKQGRHPKGYPPSRPTWKASMTKEEHAKGVERIREYVAAGDMTQTVFSIRFETSSKIDSLDLYRSLRRINPSPYMFHLKFDDIKLVGASPETMVRLEDGEMTLRPIAGTRRRGQSEKEDLVLEKELLADEKERAEHIMLVDLGRNDLGRVASPGTVKVNQLMHVERYSHVMHIVSNVQASLASGKDAFDVLRATFPAGTLSGSPKIRAMEIIEELEPVRRSFYGGCVGYFSFSGNMDMAITIRSALLKDGKVTVQAGGGIVADSVPEMEYQEVMNKSKAVMKAVEMVSEESERVLDGSGLASPDKRSER